MKITECRTNHYENPLGYHFENPVFSWKVTEAEGKKMAAARILIAADEKMADVILDTGYHTDINPLAAPVSPAKWNQHPASSLKAAECV